VLVRDIAEFKNWLNSGMYFIFLNNQSLKMVLVIGQGMSRC